jgi:hypothetical protein
MKRIILSIAAVAVLLLAGWVMFAPSGKSELKREMTQYMQRLDRQDSFRETCLKSANGNLDARLKCYDKEESIK